MSGRKYTTVSTTELARLRREAERATSLQRTVNTLNQIDSLNRQELDRYRNNINTLTNNLNQANRALNQARNETSQLRTALDNAVEQTNRRLAEQANRHARELSTMGDTLRQEMASNTESIRQYVDQNVEQLESNINQVRNDLNSQMEGLRDVVQGVEDSVASIRNDNNSLADMGREYYQMADQLMENLDNYRCDLFFPGRLSELNRDMRDVQHDLHQHDQGVNGLGATIQSDARSSFNDIMQFRQDVILAEQNWYEHQTVGIQAGNVVSQQLENGRHVNLPEISKEPIDVDFWSNNALTRLENRLNALRNALTNEQATVEELDDYREAIVEVSQEIDEVIGFAVAAVAASDCRARLAGGLGNDLSDYGFNIVDTGYQGGDQRGAYRIHLRDNVTQAEVVVTQTPVLDDNNSVVNQLESDIVNSGNGTRNADELRQAASDLLSTLSDYGLRQDELTTVEGFEHQDSNRTEIVDVAGWKDGHKTPCDTFVEPVLPTPVHAPTITATPEPATATTVS